MIQTRLLIIIAVVGLVSTVALPQTSALSCGIPPFTESYDRHDLLLHGKLVEKELLFPESENLKTTALVFDTIKVYKGDFSKTITVIANLSWDDYYREGEKYILFADKDGDDYLRELCVGDYVSSPSIIKFLDEFLLDPTIGDDVLSLYDVVQGFERDDLDIRMNQYSSLNREGIPVPEPDDTKIPIGNPACGKGATLQDGICLIDNTEDNQDGDPSNRWGDIAGTNDFDSPLKQIKNGVALIDVKCNEGKHVIYKRDRMSAACVTPETESKLIFERGWAVMRLGLPATDNLPRDLCGSYQGKWLAENKECNLLETPLQCSLLGGVYNECASACRHDPDFPNIACTDNCVEVCSIESSTLEDIKNNPVVESFYARYDNTGESVTRDHISYSAGNEDDFLVRMNLHFDESYDLTHMEFYCYVGGELRHEVAQEDILNYLQNNHCQPNRQLETDFINKIRENGDNSTAMTFILNSKKDMLTGHEKFCGFAHMEEQEYWYFAETYNEVLLNSNVTQDVSPFCEADDDSCYCELREELFGERVTYEEFFREHVSSTCPITPEPQNATSFDPENCKWIELPQIQSPKQECSGTAGCFSGTVTQVIDGDTIKVDGKSIRFTLSSAPELHDFQGPEARQFIDTICPVGSTALVDEDDGQTEGSYGRIIGVIYCNDLNLNEELLDSGLGYLSSGFCDASEFSSSLWAQKHGCTSTNDSQTSQELIEAFKEKYSDYGVKEYPDSQGNIWKYTAKTNSADVELIFGDNRTILRSYDSPDEIILCMIVNPFPKDVWDWCPPKW